MERDSPSNEEAAGRHRSLGGGLASDTSGALRLGVQYGEPPGLPPRLVAERDDSVPEGVGFGELERNLVFHLIEQLLP